MGPFTGPNGGGGTPDNTCGGQAWLSLVLIKDYNSEFGRWYSFLRAGMPLGDFGVPHTVTASLTDLTVWSSVYGKRADSSTTATKGFQAAQSGLTELALAFGGGCFAGHGVNAHDGDARFTLTNFQVVN